MPTPKSKKVISTFAALRPKENPLDKAIEEYTKAIAKDLDKELKNKGFRREDIPVPENAHKCPYCGGRTVHREDSTIIYKKNYGPVWLCENFPTCDAYVGCHKETKKPLGTLAKKELRTLRKQAHEIIDRLISVNSKIGLANPKSAVYLTLAGYLKKPVTKVHIGWMNEVDVKIALEGLSEMIKNSDV